MARVAFTHRYVAHPDAVWEIAPDYDALAQVCAPLVRFEGLPAGQVSAGQVIEVRVRLFGLLPPETYRMEVVACDPVGRRFRRREFGAGVRDWVHDLHVLPDGRGSRIEESVEIEAGWKTPLAAQWARILYRHRHRGRTRLLQEERVPE